MESKSPVLSTSKSRKLIPIIVIGIVLLVCLSIFCLFVFGIVVMNVTNSTSSPVENQIPNAMVDLKVDQDGCGVIRSEVQGNDPVQSLTWVIKDRDGYSVLERNAENEFKYRYFDSGQYKVFINAWFNGAYHQISNEVEINCK